MTARSFLQVCDEKPLNKQEANTFHTLIQFERRVVITDLQDRLDYIEGAYKRIPEASTIKLLVNNNVGNMEITDALCLFLGYISYGETRRAYLWAYTLKQIHDIGGKLTLERWADFFPFGVPADEDFLILLSEFDFDDPSVWTTRYEPQPDENDSPETS